MLLLGFTGITAVLVAVDAATAPADFGLSDMCFVSMLFPEPKRHVAPVLWPPNDRATWLASNPDSIKLFKIHKRALLLGRVNLSDDFSDAFSALMTIYVYTKLADVTGFAVQSNTHALAKETLVRPPRHRI